MKIKAEQRTFRMGPKSQLDWFPSKRKCGDTDTKERRSRRRRRNWSDAAINKRNTKDCQQPRETVEK